MAASQFLWVRKRVEAGHWCDLLAILARTGRTTFLVLLALSLAACVGRPEESKNFRDIVPMEGVELERNDLTPTGTGDYKDDDGVFNILALSGGGAYGAYGVGVLSGWTKRGTRPQFDIVTGVSTGALMSVFAFLGPQYDPMLRQLYTNVTNADIYIERGVTGVLGDSLYDNTPLKNQIERVITPQILAAVAAEHKRGRRLYVATVNLDSGQLVVWDMGEIASGRRSNPLQHFQKVLRASAAVPAFFQPVYIKPQRGVQLRQAHVDGGVKAPVLITDFLFRDREGEKNLYVIVNDSIAAKDAVAAIKPNLASISRKAISTLTRELMRQAVYRGYVRARNSGTRFHLTSVPDRLGQSATSLEFDPQEMRRLFDAGEETMRQSNPWRSQPPQLRVFDRIGN